MSCRSSIRAATTTTTMVEDDKQATTLISTDILGPDHKRMIKGNSLHNAVVLLHHGLILTASMKACIELESTQIEVRREDHFYLSGIDKVGEVWSSRGISETNSWKEGGRKGEDRNLSRVVISTHESCCSFNFYISRHDLLTCRNR